MLQRSKSYFQVAKRAYHSHASAENGKKWAGCKAIQDIFSTASNPKVIGLGSGSTIVYAVEQLAKMEELSKKVVYIPTSFQTRQLILSHNLRLGSLEQFPSIDITIDGADEIDAKLNAIKGGGGCLFQERLVAQASRRFVLVADANKKSKQLGTQWKRGVPVEVIPIALAPIQRTLIHMFPTASIKLRMATSPKDKAGPVVTDNGNLILDCEFGPITEDPSLLYKEIKCLSGVLDVGLFCNMAESAYIGHVEEDGGEILLKRNNSFSVHTH